MGHGDLELRNKLLADLALLLTAKMLFDNAELPGVWSERIRDFRPCHQNSLVFHFLHTPGILKTY